MSQPPLVVSFTISPVLYLAPAAAPPAGAPAGVLPLCSEPAVAAPAVVSLLECYAEAARRLASVGGRTIAGRMVGGGASGGGVRCVREWREPDCIVSVPHSVILCYALSFCVVLARTVPRCGTVDIPAPSSPAPTIVLLLVTTAVRSWC